MVAVLSGRVEISHKKTAVARFGDRAFHASHLRMNECMLITNPQPLVLDFSAAAVQVQGGLVICFFLFVCFFGVCACVWVWRCKCVKLGKLMSELSRDCWHKHPVASEMTLGRRSMKLPTETF